ncbi:PREDICTED: 65-kDa microtubule-associated protein 6-like isoform X1 [Populus euphratica]|uniref:65-kDa microtubule-associated protein 6-like isoform X1 n=2 Tax=Populus euphratica TaxID=75702 RepID=A0AAJ6U876_POPEU|nr:PREDICTED: 65-kDa microtubule-associated protein 6-like isoform X1 [Populus euphratica]XP_011024716.1 PREDICTED: 65-kDa microtubule-associated protein 6-like isoform X1 [Populus euphratica]XP_011024725.1 PREDICTED: 65-kDa microtubule-associated protein 6-like isoform X1 [Populus euphratica]XP_011024732.1 PREDICTED: 65-kDa microtubule-associated protein 6-like isoform X1 [Populus euphratica]XP_011024739.1 PREDICTED: 65-kDa microtubule-associated protein 6-like isoform X1 [Populus euphratica]
MLTIGSPTTSLFTSTSCNTLLRELQQIWTDIGESEAEKDRMLLELERECLEVYRRKVEDAANSKARLHQSVAAKEAELATLMAALGELSVHSPIQTDKRTRSLKEKLASVTPVVEDLRMKKEERIKQFAEIKAQIEKISSEISEYNNLNNTLVTNLTLDEQDLSLRKLSEYQTHLRSLQKEKSDRLQKVFEYVNEVHSLCGVLGLDFGKTVSGVHPSLHGTQQEQSTNISNSTLEGLEQAIRMLKLERKARMQKLKDVAASLFELWNLMDSPTEEKNKFSRITSVLGFAESEIIEPGVLSAEIIQQASTEVERLTKLKASRMKELVMKRRSDLEDVCKMTHIEPDTSTNPEKSTALIDSGLVDPSELLANIEAQIVRAKEEALSRKEIMDRIDRWLSACEEENWLEDYNQDTNRYNAGRGAHLNLKRAERARVTISKISAMVDNLILKTLAWEDEKKMLFLYDGVRLVSILEDYKLTRQQREEEKRRYRDQKKLQDLLQTEKEAMYGSKPSPRKTNSFRKPNGYRANGNGSMTPTPRRNSFGGATPELLTPRSYSGRQNGYFKEMRRLSTAPLNFVAISKEETMSFASVCGSEPGSPPQG